jgi:hypothetical protein
VYVAGTNYSGNKSVAMLWTNGEATPLTNGSNYAEAYSVYVSGNNVYAAGYEANASNVSVAQLWINGKANPITDGIKDASAYSVYVSGSDVYVSGQAYNGGKWDAALWKISGSTVTSQTLSAGVGGTAANAHSVYVSGSDVYAAGFSTDANNKVSAMLWKVTAGTVTSIPLPPTNSNYNAYAESVFVSGGVVYVAGYEYNASNTGIAKIWKINSGTATPANLSTGSSFAHSVFVSGGVVYAGGKDNDEPAVWKDGTMQKFAGGGTVKALFVSGSVVYAAGMNSNDAATVWKDGKEEPLTTVESEANSVFVK